MNGENLPSWIGDFILQIIKMFQAKNLHIQMKYLVDFIFPVSN